LRTLWPTKSTNICSTKPSTLTLVFRTRDGATSMRATVCQVAPTVPGVTLAVRKPMSCWRDGSMVTWANPATGGAAACASWAGPAAPAGDTGTSFMPQIGQSPG
jgi:hypothetical protein